eukprot:2892685-Prymnesium_polylepis.2
MSRAAWLRRRWSGRTWGGQGHENSGETIRPYTPRLYRTRLEGRLRPPLASIQPDEVEDQSTPRRLISTRDRTRPLDRGWIHPVDQSSRSLTNLGHIGSANL